MKNILILLAVFVLCGCNQEPTKTSKPVARQSLRLQLNWFHDPTFSGEYKAKQILGDTLQIHEGGVNVSPVQKLKSGLADIAVVGIDIALKAIESDISLNKSSNLRIIFVDFQRNPVGWIVHPEVTEKFGFNSSKEASGGSRNNWLFEQFKNGNIAPGDKRGTETTAVWTAWRGSRGLRGVTIVGVGFDSTIILDAPNLAYPVYMNEEPYKLGERLGREVVVFDPADDGIELYGNVILTQKEVLDKRGDDLQNFLDVLSRSWGEVRHDPENTINIVRPLYPNVSENVLRSQIKRTIEFVFFKTEMAGTIDMNYGGRLEKTINALKSAGSLGETITLDNIKQYIIPYQGSES